MKSKFFKSGLALVATAVMGLSLISGNVAHAADGNLSVSVDVPADWRFGDIKELSYSGTGELLNPDDSVEYSIDVEYDNSCGIIVGDDPYYAGVYSVTPYATVTVDGITEEITNGESFGGYTLVNSPEFTFSILPFLTTVTVPDQSVYASPASTYNPNLYTIGALPYSNVGTPTFWFSGGSLVDPTTVMPQAVGVYTVTPVFEFSPDANCNFSVTATGVLRVILSPGLPEPPTPTPSGTPTATPSPTATPKLKAATISVTGGTYSYDGSPKAAQVVTDPAGLSVSVKYSGSSSAPINSGTYGVVATITAKDYVAAEASGTVVINKINPVLKWNTPAPIKEGTKVSSKQLNPTSNVKGTFTYTVNSGALLSRGAYDVIASFIPSDLINYNSGRISTTLEVTSLRTIVVTFALGSSKIPSNVIAEIRANAAKPGESITVYGYVQPSKSLAADKLLSQQRADALAAAILKLVPSANINAVGKGRTTNPLCASAKNKCAVVEFAQ